MQWSGKTKFESGHILASSTTLINFDTIFRKTFHSVLRLRPKMGGKIWLLILQLFAALCAQYLSDDSVCFYFQGPIHLPMWFNTICGEVGFFGPQFQQCPNELRTIGGAQRMVGAHRWFIGRPIIAQQSCQGTSALYAVANNKNKYYQCSNKVVKSRK